MRTKNREGVKLLLLALPFVLFVAAFCYVPLFGWAYGFTDYRVGMSLTEANFVGFDNFLAIWQNRNEVFRVMRNTFALSFIGLGVQPPMAEWGSMLASARGFMRDYAYMVIFPGLAIVITIYAINMMGDGLRDALDPRLKD